MYGHSQVAITDLGKVPGERLHPKAAYSRCRPTGAGGGFLGERQVYIGT